MNLANSATSHDLPGLSILMPVYNECATIRPVLDRVRGVGFPVRTEIIVVDDGSTDGTTEVLGQIQEDADFRILHHEKNQGKGKAVTTALQAARGDFVVIQDADEELDPNDLLRLYGVISSRKSTACYGSRFARDNSEFRRRPAYWANRILNGICNMLNGLRLTDMNTCYKMMPVEVAKSLRIVSSGFAMEPEITTKLARMGITIIEEPVSYRPREKAEGKKIRLSDFFRYLVAMVRFRFMGRGNRSAITGQARQRQGE